MSNVQDRVLLAMVGKPKDAVSYDRALGRMTQLFMDKREEMKLHRV